MASQKEREEKKENIRLEIKQRVLDALKEFGIEESIDNIPTSSDIVKTTYSDGTKVYVDPMTEFYLCKKYFRYFITKYGFILDSNNRRIFGIKLFDFQANLILPGLTENRFVVFRKCLTENNFVQTKRGYLSIKDVEAGDEILTLKDGDHYWDQVIDHWKNEDEREVVKFTLKDGSEHESTLDHKWLTVKGWKQAKDLTVSDEIVSDFSLSRFGEEELEHDNLAKLIGYIITDGRRGNEFINTSKQYINESLEIAKQFATDSYVKARKRKLEHHKQSYEMRIVGSQYWRDLVKEFALDNIDRNKKLAPKLMSLNKKQTALLLNGMYSGDGWATYGWRENPCGLKAAKFSIGFITPNKTIAYQVQELLRRFEIKSYIRTRSAGRKKSTIDSYLLYVSGKKSALKFANEIGIDGKIDKEFVEFIENNFKYQTQQPDNKIRKIKRTGKAITYDITTKDTSTFLTNGCVAHNCRQVGASVISGLYALWRANFNIAQDILIISKTRADAQDFKEKAVVTYERLPSFLKTKPTRDGQNMTTLKLVNKSRIVVRAQSPDAGRGMTPALVILDEAAFMPHADEIWASVYPSLSVSKGQCIIVSTSNGVGNFYHRIWIDAENGDNDFWPIYIPWWKFPGRDNPWLEKIESKNKQWIEEQLGDAKVKELRQELTKDGLRDGKLDKTLWQREIDAFIKDVEETQLNYSGPREDKPWLKQQLDQLKTRKFNQEIMARFLGSGNTVISTEILEKLDAETKEPLFFNEMAEEDYMKGLAVFEKPQDGLTYSMFVDVASGSGYDYNTFQLFRDDNLVQVAEYKMQIDTKSFSANIKKVAEYYNRAYVVVETNQGLSVFNELFLHDTDPYMNMFYEFKGKAYRGLHTSPTNKKLMLDEFMHNIESGVFTLNGSRTVEELKVYIWHNGKPEASRGYNDDLVLPLMFLSYLLKYGNQHTKLLGFATSEQTIGDKSAIEEALQEEVEYMKEQRAKSFVEEAYGVDWEDYEWLVK